MPKGSAARIAALGVGLAVVLSISFSTQTYLAMINHGHAFWKILAWQLVGWLYWAVVAPWIVLRLCAGLGAVTVPARDYARVAAAGLPLVAGHLAVGGRDHRRAAALRARSSRYTFGQAFGNFVDSHLFADVLLYAGLVVVGRMLAVSERARGSRRVRRSSRPTWPGPASRRCGSRSSRTSCSTRSTRSPR